MIDAELKARVEKVLIEQTKKVAESAASGNEGFNIEAAFLSGMIQMAKLILTDEEIKTVIENSERR